MNERESGGYQAGRFEAMSRTRDAFTGNVREKINIRSQQLAVDKNDSHQVNTFNPEQFKAKTEVISTHQAQSRAEIQSAWDTYGQAEQNHLQTEFQLQVDAQLPWEIDQKLGKMGKEQVLSAIQARKAQAEKATNANTEAIAQEQALTQQEIQLEADKLLAMAPESLLAGSLAALAIWVINRLPNKVYTVAAIGAVLSLILSACSAKTPTVEVNRYSTDDRVTTEDYIDPTDQAAIGAIEEKINSAATAKANGTATPEGTTAAIISTATAEAAKTQEASRAGAFLEAYLDGQSVDVSQLSPSEFKEFSNKLAEKMNEQRGVNPVLYADKMYIHPDNYMMIDYDGHPDMEETITMYLAIAGKDAGGNLQIINEKGQIVTVANSADIDWNMVVTDPNDPRIDLAHTGPINEYNGLPTGQMGVSPEHKNIAPMILLDKNPGLIYFKYENGGMIKLPIYHFLKIETDQNGTPIMARKILVFPAGGFGIVKEGSTDIVGAFSLRQLSESSEFNSKIISNSVYYLKIQLDQEDIYKKNIFANTNGFTGIVSGNEAVANLIGQAENNTDMILLGNGDFIEPAE